MDNKGSADKTVLLVALILWLLYFSAAAFGASSLKLYLTGGVNNTNPDLSLGSYMSTSGPVSPTVPMNNIFDNVTPTERTAGDTEYRLIAVYNTGDTTATSVQIYMNNETVSTSTQLDFYAVADTLGLAETPTALLSESSTSGLSPTFTHATEASPLNLEQIPAGYWVPLYVRRVVDAGATVTTADTGGIRIKFD